MESTEGRGRVEEGRECKASEDARASFKIQPGEILEFQIPAVGEQARSAEDLGCTVRNRNSDQREWGRSGEREMLRNCRRGREERAGNTDKPDPNTGFSDITLRFGHFSGLTPF